MHVVSGDENGLGDAGAASRRPWPRDLLFAGERGSVAPPPPLVRGTCFAVCGRRRPLLHGELRSGSFPQEQCFALVTRATSLSRRACHGMPEFPLSLFAVRAMRCATSEPFQERMPCWLDVCIAEGSTPSFRDYSQHLMALSIALQASYRVTSLFAFHEYHCGVLLLLVSVQHSRCCGQWTACRLLPVGGSGTAPNGRVSLCHVPSWRSVRRDVCFVKVCPGDSTAAALNTHYADYYKMAGSVP